jgi:hypothetical protein
MSQYLVLHVKRAMMSSTFNVAKELLMSTAGKSISKNLQENAEVTRKLAGTVAVDRHIL